MPKEEATNLSESDILKLINRSASNNKYTRLVDYYEGKHKILYYEKGDKDSPNNRLINNMAKYITDTATGYFAGQPVTYSSNNDDLFERMKEVFVYNDEHDHNAELAKMNSIYGSAVEMLYIDENSKIRIARLAPKDVILIYENSFREPVAAIRKIIYEDISGNSYYKVEYWTDSVVWYFDLKGDKLVLSDVEEHYFNDVPFVEYINNEERLGDFEGVITLIDAYNKVQSNTANIFEYNDDAILKVTKMGDVDSAEIAEMRRLGAIILEDDGDIDWLLKPIEDTAIENYKKRLREDMHIFSNVPNMTDSNFGSNLSGVAISYKLWGLEQICAIKERKFKTAIQRRIELITNIFNTQGGNYSYMDISMQFKRNKPKDLVEAVEVTSKLVGVVSHETALQQLPFIDDARDEMEKLEREDKAARDNFGGGKLNVNKHFEVGDGV